MLKPLKKPLVLLCQNSDISLLILGRLVRSFGYDVCACLPGELPERRRWERFSAAIVDSRGVVPADLSIDVLCTGERFSPEQIRYCLSRFCGGGGGGEVLPGWGWYRVVGKSGCGFLERGGEHRGDRAEGTWFGSTPEVAARPRAS